MAIFRFIFRLTYSLFKVRLGGIVRKGSKQVENRNPGHPVYGIAPLNHVSTSLNKREIQLQPVRSKCMIRSIVISIQLSS
jgi:hypothetical protein